MNWRDKLGNVIWPLPKFKMDRKFFEELVSDEEFTKGEGDCAGHTPVEFCGESCNCCVRNEIPEDHSITCPCYWKLTPQEEAEKKNRFIAEEICAEQRRQVEKWGEQNHPNLAVSVAGNLPSVAAQILGIPTAEQAKARCEQDFSLQHANWASILIEELAEVIEQAALEEDERLRAELIQVGAVTASWVAAIDRRQKTKT